VSKSLKFIRVRQLPWRKNNPSIWAWALDEIALEQNYPNPFNSLTSISYSVAQDMHISVKIYNIAGQEVAALVDGYHNSGNYSVVFDASGLPTGIYFTVLKAGTERRVRRIVLIK
jgi:hypothetical protein